ncbi:hypothetical protein ACVIGB_008626 [Bradyrhizobium sp. USDA 4341]
MSVTRDSLRHMRILPERIAGAGEITAEPGDLDQIVRQRFPSCFWFVVEETRSDSPISVAINASVGGASRAERLRLVIDKTSQLRNAKGRDRVGQTLGGPELRLLTFATRCEDLVEDLVVPSRGIPFRPSQWRRQEPTGRSVINFQSTLSFSASPALRHGSPPGSHEMPLLLPTSGKTRILLYVISRIVSSGSPLYSPMFTLLMSMAFDFSR